VALWNGRRLPGGGPISRPGPDRRARRARSGSGYARRGEVRLRRRSCRRLADRSARESEPKRRGPHPVRGRVTGPAACPSRPARQIWLLPVNASCRTSPGQRSSSVSIPSRSPPPPRAPPARTANVLLSSKAITSEWILGRLAARARSPRRSRRRTRPSWRRSHRCARESAGLDLASIISASLCSREISCFAPY